MNTEPNYKGVNFMKSKGKWRVRVTIKKKEVHLGLFETKEQAIQVRKAAERKYGV